MLISFSPRPSWCQTWSPFGKPASPWRSGWPHCWGRPRGGSLKHSAGTPDPALHHSPLHPAERHNKLLTTCFKSFKQTKYQNQPLLTFASLASMSAPVSISSCLLPRPALGLHWDPLQTQSHWHRDPTRQTLCLGFFFPFCLK
uniref:Uncharacterized protein n=1 Tax=Poecilia mexicana TaxID=48701 RepID=A0A3B3X393_9TELE